MRQLKKELWPFKVTVKVYHSHYEHDKRIDEIEWWLGENLGVFKDKWSVVYLSDRTDFYFKDDQTATFFALRWS